MCPKREVRKMQTAQKKGCASVAGCWCNCETEKRFEVHSTRCTADHSGACSMQHGSAVGTNEKTKKKVSPITPAVIHSMIPLFKRCFSLVYFPVCPNSQFVIQSCTPQIIHLALPVQSCPRIPFYARCNHIIGCSVLHVEHPSIGTKTPGHV